MPKSKRLSPRAIANCVAGTAVAVAGASADAAPQVTGAITSIGVVGDANRDGIANALDLSIVQTNLNTAGTWSKGDFDGNGFVDSTDLTLLNDSYGRARPAAFFGKVADSNTVIPGSANKFTGAINTPVIDQTGTVAFIGQGTGSIGVYRYQNGALSKVADTTTAVPSGTTNFLSFGLPNLYNGRVGFVGYDNNNRDGIYTDRTGTLARVVDLTSIRPPTTTSKYSGFGSPSLYAGGVGFTARVGANWGVYNYSGATGQTSEVYLSTVGVPSGTGTFTSLGRLTADGASMYFDGQAMAQWGIYKSVGTTTTMVMNLSSTVPGTDARFTTSLSNVARSGDNLSFNGTLAGRSGIFGLINGAVRTIADSSTPIPDGGGWRFDGKFGFSSIGGSSVVFVGRHEENGVVKSVGVYAWSNGELQKVIDSSVTLGGKLIKDLFVENQAVAGNRVAFRAIFTDNTQGAFVASLVPTPAPGDLNADGVTDPLDARILRRNYGKSGGYSQGDLDGDGSVSFADFQLMEQYMGRVGGTPLRGDADGDGKVDSADYGILRANYGKYGSVAQGDFDHDGRITFNDFQIFEGQAGKTGPTYQPFGAIGPATDMAMPDAVPEPGALGVVGLALMGLGRRKRR
ncbi:MAG: dockerin type I domain-containing protein [Phycisphaerae bacterium]|nr:dockerin type I domain-containing protein [Tepidisphaeraceae bacterium]